MKRMSIPEVLKSLEGKSHEEIVKKLRIEDTRALRLILYLSFSENLLISLPTDRPEDLKLQDVPVGLSQSNLFRESRKLRIFVKGSGYDHLKTSKREQLFIELLESIHQDEAELVLQIMVDRELQSSITYNDVFHAFPGLLPEKSEKKPKPKKVSKPKVQKKKSEPKPKVEEPKPVIKEEPKPEPVVEEPSKEEEVEELEDRIEDLEEALEDLKSDLNELNEEEPPKEEKESESFKNLSEVYEKKSEKKTKTKKKSSKKKSK